MIIQTPTSIASSAKTRAWVVYAVLTVLAIAVNLPGRANPDTIDMLWQAHEPASLNDWHSPFVTFAFSLLAPIFGSPTGALILQSLLLMTWPALLLTRALEAKAPPIARVALIVAVFCVCAVFVALAGQVSKDGLLLSLLSFAFFLLSRDLDDFALAPSGGAMTGAFFLLLGVALIRSVNFLALTAAAAVAWALIATGTLALGGLAKQRAGAALLVACIVFAAAPFGVRWILDAKVATPQDSPILFDLAGVSVESGINVFQQLAPDEPPLQPKPEDCYNSHSSDAFLWGPCKGYEDLLNRHRDKVFATWRHAIADHAGFYIVHRAAFMEGLLGGGKQPNRMVVPPPPFDLATNGPIYIDPMPERMKAGLALWRPTVAYTPFGRVADFAFRKWPGRPWIWLVVLAAAAAGSWRLPPRQRPVPLLLATLGVANVLAIAFLSGSDDLRYLLMTWFCAVASIAFYGALAVRRLTSQTPQRSALDGGDDSAPAAEASGVVGPGA